MRRSYRLWVSAFVGDGSLLAMCCRPERNRQGATHAINLRLKKRQSDQMCGDTKSDINHAAVAQGRLPIGQVNFDVMVLKEGAIQRKNCFVYSLLDCKK